MKTRLRFALLLLALLCTACTTRESGEASVKEADSKKTSIAQESSAAQEEPVAQMPQPDQRMRYRIYLGRDKSLIMNAAGQRLVSEGEPSPCTDVLTGAILARNVTRMEDTGKDNPDGSPIARQISALYDPNGVQLQEFQEMQYGDGFGEYLIRQEAHARMMEPSELGEDYETHLWNYKTGEVLVDDVYKLAALGEDTVLLMDRYGTPLGVMDAQGNVVSGFPPPKTYFAADATHGYITASTANPYWTDGKFDRTEVLLTSDFVPITQRNTVNGNFYGLRGPYWLYRDESPTQVQGILNKEGQVLYTTQENQYLEYFDGERVIVHTEDARENAKSSLTNAQGTILADGFEHLEADGDYSDKEIAQVFVGLRQGQMELINRDGEVLVQKPQPARATSIRSLRTGLYTCSIESESGGTREMLLGADLEMITEPDRYEVLTNAISWEANKQIPLAYLQAGYTVGSSFHWDILDLQGNLCVEGLSQIGDMDANGFAAQKGFSMGLMGFQGNWIAEYSIFNELIDD